MTQFIILDRDGVINQDSYNYIKSVDEFIFNPGAIDAIAQLTKAGYSIGIATNQSGVSRGLYSEAILSDIHKKLIDDVEASGGKIAAIEYCIHLPTEHCFCRKPQPGMLQALANRMHCSLNGVPFVGDRISDIQAAIAAGAQPVMVISPMTDKMGLQDYPGVPVYHSLAEYVRNLLA
jgi:D-glycero-D-manno-heptose 1,7-bisphosphate phosphatase